MGRHDLLQRYVVYTPSASRNRELDLTMDIMDSQQIRYVKPLCDPCIQADSGLNIDVHNILHGNYHGCLHLFGASYGITFQHTNLNHLMVRHPNLQRSNVDVFFQEKQVGKK